MHMDMKSSERKQAEQLRNIEQRHAAELRRIKSLNETSTKLKQEKWMDEKTRRIKEQTGKKCHAVFHVILDLELKI